MVSDIFTKHDKPKITALVNGFFAGCEDGKEYRIEIKEYRKKRSLDANALAWAEISQVAAATGVPKTEVYKSYIKEIGGNSEVLCIQNFAVERFCEHWESNGIGWITDRIPSKIEGCTNIIAYYGSSTFDTGQMHRLITLVEQDCKEYGIPTYEDIVIQEALERWEKSSG